jgi:putative flippase GtrA
MSGLIATATDAAVLVALTLGFGVDPYSARVAAIAVAMVAGFFAHRRLSFGVTEAATLAQFGKFISVAASVSIINYAIYAGVLLFKPGTGPLLAFAVATVFSIAASYFGLRFGVFRKPPA